MESASIIFVFFQGKDHDYHFLLFKNPLKVIIYQMCYMKASEKIVYCLLRQIEYKCPNMFV